MKSAELRIGNYCLDCDNKLCKIVSIHENGRIRVELPKVKDVPLGSFNVSFAKGIPLTEEILLKCGFEWFKEAFGYFDKLHAVYLWESGEIEVHPFCTNDKDCHIFIKHLHQLQNLIFALTGEELNIEL